VLEIGLTKNLVQHLDEAARAISSWLERRLMLQQQDTQLKLSLGKMKMKNHAVLVQNIKEKIAGCAM
jgi:hypothetical protein